MEDLFLFFSKGVISPPISPNSADLSNFLTPFQSKSEMSVEKDQNGGDTSYATSPPRSEDLEDGASADRLLGKAYEKKVLKKVDFWLVWFYSLVYIFRVIDSSNYSNAAIINLENGTNIKKQLHLSPN